MSKMVSQVLATEIERIGRPRNHPKRRSFTICVGGTEPLDGHCSCRGLKYRIGNKKGFYDTYDRCIFIFQ